MKLPRLGFGVLIGSVVAISVSVSPSSAGGTAAYPDPTWWSKAQYVLNATSAPPCTLAPNGSQPPNVDMSNELTPQSETSIAINPSNPSQIVGGSNEIFCLPMRGYFSTQGGKSGSWQDVNLPLPPPITTNGQDFGSDPGVAWDTLGNVYYSYIVVFFNRAFSSIQGTEMAVARSSDHGQTWTATYFNENSGTGKFNDKPMITSVRTTRSTSRGTTRASTRASRRTTTWSWSAGRPIMASRSLRRSSQARAAAVRRP